MKKNLLSVALLGASLSVYAQNVICNVEPNTLFFVGESALVYNGGGLQTKGSGRYDVHGNLMVVGTASDAFRTLNAAGSAPKNDGGNIILRLNNPANHSSGSTYGQLYIKGLTQTSGITAVVDKEFRTTKHGTYQQIALPFYNKTISSLSGAPNAIGTLGKNFSNTRYSQNEVLTWNNRYVVSDNLAVSNVTPKATTYYMLGSKNMDSGNPPASMPANAPAPNGSVYTLRGVPFADGITEKLVDAGLSVNFGTTGNALNSYNERYNSYHEDQWDQTVNPSNPWTTPTFGRNMYQFGNPFLTNLDLSMIGYIEPGTVTDNNNLQDIQGIRYDPGTVATGANGTLSTGAKLVNFTASVPVPVGDVGLIIKPMQTFVIKMRNNLPETGNNRTLIFDNLRRFKNTPRLSGTGYDVTARQGGTVKQLGIIGLDDEGNEVTRTYYVVYADAISGTTSSPTTQAAISRFDFGNGALVTYEENAATGGVDYNVEQLYQLYINEANETDFFGKEIAVKLDQNFIKSLKFELRENAALLEDGASQLSSGVSFYYQMPGGQQVEIAQNKIIPANGNSLGVFYGKSPVVLGTGGVVKKGGTRVAYNSAIDNYVVRFDPQWKKADITVYDLSGKLISTAKDVSAAQDYVIKLAKSDAAYIVQIVSADGTKVSAKIIR